jgi:AcrR family transcriptional regulator
MRAVQPNRQKARSEAARTTIVSAAISVFAESGYTPAAMDEVCRRAGCSKGGLYHHFRSKRALLAAVVDRMASAGAFYGRPAVCLDGAVTPEQEARLVLEIWAEAARDGELRAQLMASARPSGDRLAAVLHAGLIVRRAVHAVATVEPRDQAA